MTNINSLDPTDKLAPATMAASTHDEQPMATPEQLQPPGKAGDGAEDSVPEPSAQVAPGSTDDAVDETEENPPLPPGPPPKEEESDDGWQPVWDASFGRYYFYNALTNETTWTNPRVQETPDETAAPEPTAIGVESSPDIPHDPLRYNPAIHGDYDPTAPYAQPREETLSREPEYTTVAAFNRFTGKFQSAQSHQVPENYNDENKSKRQMEFFFDVDAAANSHEGRSLKAERQTKKLSKKELKQFKEKRKQRKEEKRKAWLKD